MGVSLICLDTNYLIGSITRDSLEARAVRDWIREGERLITPMPAWYEFLCGPANEGQIATVRAILDEITVFAEPQALEAARLFNATGRKRTLHVDCMIAATALIAGATLATRNRSDFIPFSAFGLLLTPEAQPTPTPYSLDRNAT